jgi:hypothetical protein
MSRFRKFLTLVGVGSVGAAVLAASAPAHADLSIRVTDMSGGAPIASRTVTVPSNPDGSGTAVFTGAVGNFTVNLHTDNTTTGPGFTAASETLNFTYGGRAQGQAAGDTLVVEFLGTGLTNPTVPAQAFITSNGSPSTSGLMASSVTFSSTVIAGNATLGSTILTGQGTTTETGSLGGASSVLVPNPSTGPIFSISNPFSFYQDFIIGGFTNTGSGSISAGSTVNAVTPEPATVALALPALPVIGIRAYRRRRRSRA